jgi:hypothetical protein
MTMPLAHPAQLAPARPRSTTAPGFSPSTTALAANDAGRPIRLPGDDAFIRVAAAAAAAVGSVAWLDAIARIAAYYG